MQWDPIMVVHVEGFQTYIDQWQRLVYCLILFYFFLSTFIKVLLD